MSQTGPLRHLLQRKQMSALGVIANVTVALTQSGPRGVVNIRPPVVPPDIRAGRREPGIRSRSA
jgi:hypothetical protein